MKLSKDQISKVSENGISGIFGIFSNSNLKEKREYITYREGGENMPNMPNIPPLENKNEAKPEKRKNVEIVPTMGSDGLISYSQVFQKIKDLSFPFDDLGHCKACGIERENKHQINCGDCLRKSINEKEI